MRVFVTSPVVGFWRFSLACVLALGCAPRLCAQTVIEAPPSEPMVDQLRDSFDAPDARTRYESVRWLRLRTTPAAFQVLRRATRDPVPAIAFEGLMGLAEIAPEYELDGYQMRHLDAQSRVRLIRVASGQGLMSLASLRAIALDSSAEASERGEALLAMRALGEEPRPSMWLAMLGARDERVRLLAAVSVITKEPRIRAVAVAQEHAMSIVRASVRDASSGRIESVVGVLGDLRLAPTEATGDWCLALLSACEDGSTPERSLVAREAIRTLIVAQPTHPEARQRWLKLCAQAEPEEAPILASWALSAAATLDNRGANVPSWLATLPTNAAPGSAPFIASVSRAIEAWQGDPAAFGAALVGVVASGGPEGRAMGVRLVLGLPEQERGRAMVSILEQSDSIGLEAEWQLRLSRELASQDPIGAEKLLERSAPESVLAISLALEGVWTPSMPESSTLALARAVHHAEREIEGARTLDRSKLASQMELVIADTEVFHPALRGEAAWLALVLRDQSSEAMARLPLLSPVYDADLSLELEHADSLLQWAQMPYP